MTKAQRLQELSKVDSMTYENNLPQVSTSTTNANNTVTEEPGTVSGTNWPVYNISAQFSCFQLSPAMWVWLTAEDNTVCWQMPNTAVMHSLDGGIAYCLSEFTW